MPKALRKNKIGFTIIASTVFAESAMGAQSTAMDGDNEHTSGTSSYAPVYTYYNWSTHDTARQGKIEFEG